MAMSAIASRMAKNSVFIDMFEQPEYRLQMLQVLHPEMTDVTADDITTVTLKQVITNHQYNDLAFVVRDRLMVFVEAQSTWSNNMTMRLLLYLADTIQTYIHDRGMNIHTGSKLPLPRPEFYVIYTGERYVSEWISLKEDFFEDADCPIDLRARVFTAETDDIIGQYIIFCRVFDLQIQTYSRTERAAQETIRICQDRGVLKEYLKTREQEVLSIMIMLFDQEYASQAYGRDQYNKGHDKGREEGESIGLKKGESIGLKKGESIGLRKGRQEGESIGLKKGQANERVSNIRALMAKLKLSAKEAMEMLDIPAEEQAQYASML